MNFFKFFLFFILSYIISSDLFSQNIEIDSLDNLLEKYTKEDTVRVNILNETAEKLHRSDIDNSFKYTKEAEKLSIKLNYKKGKADSYYNFGIVYHVKSNYPLALDFYNRSLDLKKELGEKSGISSCYYVIGLIYISNENYSEALKSFQESLLIKEKLNDKEGVANSLNNIALIYERTNDLELAHDYYDRCIEMGERNNYNSLLGWAYNGKGVVLEKQKNYKEAFKLFDTGLFMRENINDEKGISQSCNSIGSLFIELKQFQNAEEYFLRAYKIANNIQNVVNLSDAAEGLSKLYQKTGKFEKSLEYYKVFKQMSDSLNNEEDIKQFTAYEISKEYEKEKQAIELERQRKAEVMAEKDKRQKAIRLILITGILLMILLLLVNFRNLVMKRKANNSLKIQKKEIEKKSGKLKIQNDEIQTLNEELSSSNEQLHDQREELEVTLTKLKETQSNLIQSEKMASVGVLISGITHEINNPLNFIMGGKFSIENYSKKNLKNHLSVLEPKLNMIDEGIERISEIVKSLSRFSRASESFNENCDIHSIIDNCLIVLNNKIKDKIEIDIDYSNTHNTVIGNEGRLHQVILNILINAVQAIENKGIITIVTNVENESFKIKISDSGYGINKDNIKKVADPFFSTKDPGDGVGLGLSIAYKIIEEHKGKIEFRSKEKLGTIVTVSLPLVEK